MRIAGKHRARATLHATRVEFTCRICGAWTNGPSAATLRADIATGQAAIEKERDGVFFAWGYAQASLNWAADALDEICAECGKAVRAGKVQP